MLDDKGDQVAQMNIENIFSPERSAPDQQSIEEACNVLAKQKLLKLDGKGSMFFFSVHRR